MESCGVCNENISHIISWWTWRSRDSWQAFWARASPLPPGSSWTHHGLCILVVVTSTTRGPRSTSLPWRTPWPCGTCLTLGDKHKHTKEILGDKTEWIKLEIRHRRNNPINITHFICICNSIHNSSQVRLIVSDQGCRMTVLTAEHPRSSCHHVWTLNDKNFRKAEKHHTLQPEWFCFHVYPG